MEEALSLMGRVAPRTVPLGGGTLLSHGNADSVEVVDLQALGLDQIMEKGKNLEIGATATLQSLLEHKACPAALRMPLKLEAPLNLRNAATLGGTLVSCDGRSTFTTALLALDAKLNILGRGQMPQGAATKALTEGIGDFLPLRPAGLITSLTFSLQARLAFEFVARTPADKPIVCVALAQWPSGRTRLAVGGYGVAPRLAMDGTEARGLDVAARSTFHDSGDEWGSAEYRMDVAATLTNRCLAALAS
jgi:CO/xanthine dehydrogenase FAD-binding subunit